MIHPLRQKTLDEFDENGWCSPTKSIAIKAFLTTALQEALIAGKHEGIEETTSSCENHRKDAREEGILEGLEMAEGAVKEEQEWKVQVKRRGEIDMARTAAKQKERDSTIEEILSSIAALKKEVMHGV